MSVSIIGKLITLSMSLMVVSLIIYLLYKKEKNENDNNDVGNNTKNKFEELEVTIINDSNKENNDRILNEKLSKEESKIYKIKRIIYPISLLLFVYFYTFKPDMPSNLKEFSILFVGVTFILMFADLIGFLTSLILKIFIVQNDDNEHVGTVSTTTTKTTFYHPITVFSTRLSHAFKFLFSISIAVGGIASFFYCLSYIFHFQILTALGYFFLGVIMWVFSASIYESIN